MRFIGLDVHRDFCEVAIAEAGVVRLAGRVQTEPAALEQDAEDRQLGKAIRLRPGKSRVWRAQHADPRALRPRNAGSRP